MFCLRNVVLLLMAIICLPARAAEPKPPRGLDMEYGPFLSYAVLQPGAPTGRPEKVKKGDVAVGYPWAPGDLLAARGITVKVAPDACVCFDADTMRYAAAWTGGFLDVTKSHLANEKGSLPPSAKGTLAFRTHDGPGVAEGSSLADPRNDHVGPLPKTWAHYQGVYRDGETVVFSYTIGSTAVLDRPSAIVSGNHVTFLRTLKIGPSTQSTQIRVCDGGAAIAADPRGFTEPNTLGGGDGLYVTGDRLPPGAQFGSAHGEVILSLPPLPDGAQFTVAMSRGAAPPSPIPAPTEDLSTHTHGGPALWPDAIETHGSLGPEKDAYTVDTVGLPDKNPWHAWVRPTALDFFKDGRCAICTWNGDVWIAANLAGKLDHVQWKRFASGLYDPLGLRIVNDAIYVCARGGIVKLHDLNGDGEADFYENFNNDRPSSPFYNSFAMDLQTDSAGNFYYALAGTQQGPDERLHNDLVRVAPDGSYLEEIATGLRTANGMGVGPHDEITIADNQGNWVPTSPIFLVRPGGFYNFAGDPHRYTKPQMQAVLREHPKAEQPICWIPYAWDTSAGSQVWTSEKFGPLSGHMLHLSYGKATIFEVLTEQLDGVWQGAVVQLPLHFDSGIQRARVNPADGQVWVCGLHGWQTAGAKDGCLQRVRYTNKPCRLPTAIHVGKAGFTLTFPVELDPETAQDVGSYSVEQWVYRITENYGSDDYKPSQPDTKGRDTLDVKKATLSADKRSVTLDLGDLKPVQQYLIKLRINAADGGAIKCDVGGTINVVPHAE